MAIELWELSQLQKGNYAAADAARKLRAQYGDVPLDTVLDPEFTDPRIQLFTDEAREQLVKKGFDIYRLGGKSIEELKYEYPDFIDADLGLGLGLDAMPSRLSEVAVRQFFNTLESLRDSGGKTFAEQVRRMQYGFRESKRRMTRIKQGEVGDVDLIVGTLPDYVELLTKIRALRGDVMFDGIGGRTVIRTLPEFHSESYRFSPSLYFDRISGRLKLEGSNVRSREKNEDIRIVPLVVPAQITPQP